MGEFLIPFEGRGSTGVYGQNLLWKSGHLYVMDNHRAAAWCWKQELDDTKAYGLFHIDRHPDCLETDLPLWVAKLEGRGLDLSIDEYLAESYLAQGKRCKLFRWDNYLPIYLELNAGKVDPVYFATHHDGDMPSMIKPIEVEPWRLLKNMKFWIEDAEVPFIVNLDLDYFFCDDDKQKAVRLVDDAYIERLARIIGKLDDAGKISVITIAMTATNDLTHGWSGVERMTSQICAILGHPFQIPDDPVSS